MKHLIEHPQMIFEIQSADRFNELAVGLFGFQYKNNTIYRTYVDHLGIDPEKVDHPEMIPFLPIEFFKTHSIIRSDIPLPELLFESSGTTGMVNSIHYVHRPAIYLESAVRCFEMAFGPLHDHTFLCLMPSYLERPNSSLIYMLDHFVRSTAESGSGFFLNNHDELAEKLVDLSAKGRKVILWGVTFALLDLIEQHRFSLPSLIVMETGGMKGRRKELVREELHNILQGAFGVDRIWSEYGMTELLSQCYLDEPGLFNPPPWMRISVRDVNDPLSPAKKGKTGGINIIDLANVDSCAFIATQDLGRLHEDGRFEVLGRFDHSDVRGCNLLI